MLKLRNSLSVQSRTLLLVAGLMVTLSVALIVTAHRATIATVEAQTHSLNDVGVKTLLDNLRTEFDGIGHTVSPDGAITRVTWPTMPETLPDDRVDIIGEATGLHVTVFRWVPSTQEYVREATTIQTENGRAVGTVLARGAVYDAMIAGEGYRAEADILGQAYLTYYQPVVDAEGQPVAILFVGREMSAIRAALANRLILTSLLVLAALGASLAAAFWMLRAMFRPLSDMTQTITALANQDLDVAIPATNQNDEIGRIGEAVAVLRASMIEAQKLAEAEKTRQAEQESVVNVLADALSRLSNLDLTTQIETDAGTRFPDEYDGVRRSFNTLAQSFSGTIEQIRDRAEEVSSGASELAVSSEELSKRTETQAATLEQSAAALEELSQTVQSTSANAAQAEKSMADNRDAAQSAGGIVRDAVAAMERIERSSSKISQIISVIDEIAFQTNLLALNAGVEAARAGAAGHGFAVVASEVRALALRSSDSAKEIRELIQESSQEVTTGSALVNQAGSALTDIVERIENVSHMISEISNSAQQQSNGIGELTIGVRDLDNVTQHNAAMSEEASASSNTVKQAAEDLVGHVAAFVTTRSSARKSGHAAGKSMAGPATGASSVSGKTPPPAPTPATKPVTISSASPDPMPLKAAAGASWSEF